MTLKWQGRPLTVSAPDGASTAYTYADGYNGSTPYLVTGVTDALGHTTMSRTDIWGRTILVDPPDGPSVSYAYDVSDRLVGVTYGTAETMLQYDYAGRKLFMDDPDMGDWTYTYDALGNLLSQADARGCTMALTYDLLNRLTGKSYVGSCGAATTAVAYTYDQGANGVGRRARMDDGSGYTTWSYDSRGRVTEAYQSLTGSGTFRTQWSYNAADLPVWMKYPADNAGSLGETVNFTYNSQMLVDRVYGTDTYVDDTWYDPAGRITLRELGASYTLGQSYAYYPWTQQGGRLQSLQSGIAADTDSLQSLSYSYDAGGNVLTINDYHATTNPSDPQVQQFNYDALNRLANAQAINGETNGRYPQQSYDYNPDTGNMETNAGMDYAYTYPNAPAGVAPVHGVRQVTGGIVYNGTVTVRARGTNGCSGWPVMKLYINGTLRQQWTVNKTSYFNYTVTTGLTTDAQVDVVFTNACTGRTLQVDYVTLPTATGSRTVQAESGGTAFDRGAETGGLGENAFDGVNVINGAELMSENGSLRFVVGLNALASGYDANGNMTLRLKDGARYFLAYDAENRLKTVSGTVSASFTYNGDGQRVASTIGTTTTAYIGGHFEWQAGSGTSYYFAGAQRVAMRTSTGVKYLLGDHLGSTAVTAYANGAFDTETRYYPWGGVRWSYGAPPTDYQFTGQQNVVSIGLYFYNARWYDSALGRFVQADTIIPNPRRPLSFDRFAYVQNNPIKYTDPTGHWSCGDQYDPACAETTEEKFQYYLLTNPLPPGMELPPELPTVVDDDMQLLLAFVYLWNTPTGRVFAQLILDENVILSWALEGELSTTEKTGKGTLSGELVPTIQVSISVDDYWNPAAAAVALAHEAVHVLMHDHPNSQWEEYTAYRIESEVASELNGHGWASLNIRYQFSSDPRPSPGYLEEWAKLYRLYGIQFQSLPPYPNALDYLSP